MFIFNIFCDASINTTTKVACGGAIVVLQDTETKTIKELDREVVIQENATNNTAEILAIWVGIKCALNFRNQYPDAVFRLFSDSKISLYGLRDWMKNWISKIRDDGTLISSSGEPVRNQQRFIDIFNIIVETGLKIEFYHQRGHVKDNHMSSAIARGYFIKANKVTPEMLGLSIETLSDYNDKIDRVTRDAIIYAKSKD